MPVASAPALTQAPASTVSPTADVRFNPLNNSCVWIALGLVLIVAGIVVLIRWRRSG